MRARPDGAKRSPSNTLKVSNGSSASSAAKAPLSSVLNGSSAGKSTSNGASSSHASPAMTSNHLGKNLKFFGLDREELTRILIQGLSDLGYASSSEALSRESGYDLETPFASAFRMAVLQGDWAEAEALLADDMSQINVGIQVATSQEPDIRRDSISRQYWESNEREFVSLALAREADRDEMLFLIRQQKYLELLEVRDLGAALMVLRQELQPLHQNERQLHALSSLIMCQSIEDLKSQAAWDGAHGFSRKELLSKLSRFISPSTMIPEHRLAELLHSLKRNQILNCIYHNAAEWPSLYTDHVCQRDDFPLTTAIEIDKHRDEVWYLQFSHDGSKLATASKDKTVLIHETTTWKLLHTLEHRDHVAYVSWSPDDTKIITCTKEARLWDTRLGTCMRTISNRDESAAGSDTISSAAWAPDGQSFVTGSLTLKKTLCIWPTDSRPDVTPLHDFTSDCARVRECAIAALSPPTWSLAAVDAHSEIEQIDSSRPIRLVAICVDEKINIFDYVKREKLSTLLLDSNPTLLSSLSLSRDGQEMLISLGSGEVWTMGVEDGQVRQKYRGHQQGECVIKSRYGGALEGFVISGGEDAKICIWHRHTGRLLEQLEGHGEGYVNAVAWNMAMPGMFASAGDDSKVRIWMKTRPSTGDAPLRSSELAHEAEQDDLFSQDKSKPPSWGTSSQGTRGAPGASVEDVLFSGGATPALGDR